MGDIYLDHAVTSPVLTEVISAMKPFFNQIFANSASSHLQGQKAAAASLSVSHVLNAIKLEKEYLKGALRFSLGSSNSKEEIDYVVKKLKDFITRLDSLN